MGITPKYLRVCKKLLIVWIGGFSLVLIGPISSFATGSSIAPSDGTVHHEKENLINRFYVPMATPKANFALNQQIMWSEV